MTYTTSHIDDYENRLTEEQKLTVVEHANNFELEPNICAWYNDMEDFYSDWVGELHYTEEEARRLLCENDGEFLCFDNDTIIRFVK